MADMHFLYCCPNRNSLEALHLYAEHCLKCRIPSHILFIRLHWRLTESVSFAPWASDRARPWSVPTPDMEHCVLRRVEENPGSTVWTNSAAKGISVSLIWRILYEQSINIYHFQQVLAFTSSHCCARVEFSPYFLTNFCWKQQSVFSILFTDVLYS